MKIIYQLVSLLIFISSCSHRSLKDNIVSNIKINVNRDSFTILLSDLIDARWDSLYSFNEYSDYKIFSKYFTDDLRMPKVPDANKRYVFSFKNKVVFWEDVSLYNSPPFYISNDSSYNNFIINKSAGMFIVQKLKDNLGKEIYSIHPDYEKR